MAIASALVFEHELGQDRGGGAELGHGPRASRGRRLPASSLPQIGKALDMEPQIEKFFSEAHRRSYDRGKAEGEAKGKAEALLMLLRRRGLAMTSDQQHRIITCTDLATLDRWLDRAFSVASVASVDELLA